MKQNYNVYERGAVPGTPQSLTYKGASNAGSPERAVMNVVTLPGKYVVTDLDYTEICTVYVTLEAKAV